MADTTWWLTRIGFFLLLSGFWSSLLGGLWLILAGYRSRRIPSPEPLLIVHVIFWFLPLGVLAYMFLMNRFDILLVWKYSSTELPWYFRLSALWSSQEGSFLLWGGWHALLGWLAYRIFLHRAPNTPLRWKQWFASGILLYGSFLFTFILGWKGIGSNPFVLTAEAFSADPVFSLIPGYVPEQGSGLNPLLRSYWMLVHPPVLFAGYSSVLYPALFLLLFLGARSSGDPASRWLNRAWYITLLFSAGFLGAGIALGALWAYEALSFGGFWAWDPVENASLMPWLALIGTQHLAILWQRRRKALAGAVFLQILALGLVIYSAFLTRSGILGDSSVHSFTDLGLGNHLVIFLLLTVAVCAGVAIAFIRLTPPLYHSPSVSLRISRASSDDISSREFWILTGVLILQISLLQIFIDTSRPVWNTLFGWNWAPPSSPEEYYTRLQTPLAILLFWTMGFALLLRYGHTSWRQVWKPLALLGIASILVGSGLAFRFADRFPAGTLLLMGGLLAGSTFGILSALYYWGWTLRRKWNRLSDVLSHAGFGLLILGAWISLAGKTIYRDPRSPVGENLVLIQGNARTVGKLTFLFLGREPQSSDEWVYYVALIDTSRKDTLRLALRTAIQQTSDDQINLVAHPSIVHRLASNLFIHVVSAPVLPQDSETSSPIQRVQGLLPGDSLHTDWGILYLNSIQPIRKLTPSRSPDTIGIRVEVLFSSSEGIRRGILTYAVVGDTLIVVHPDTFARGNVITWVDGVNPGTGEVQIGVRWIPRMDWVVIRVLQFPGINLVWVGMLLVIVGFFWGGIRELRRSPFSPEE